MRKEVSENAIEDYTFSSVKVGMLLAVTLFLSSLMIPPVGLARAKKAAIDGSFITGDLCGSWTNARWQKEFTAMKDAGMHYLIIASVADCSPGKVTQTLYPSHLPNTELAPYLKGHDVVNACLRNAESAGIRVFIGISANDRWWEPHGKDTTWMYSQMRFDNRVCDEVWSLYKHKYPKAFYGWYWAYEVDNFSFTTKAEQKELIHAMNIELDHLSAKHEKLPFMWCPYMNSHRGTPKPYEKMWKYVFDRLHTTEGDIFCPQDCVGARGLKLDQVPAWFLALREAVDTKPGLKMWSDVETFDLRDNTSATIDRLVSQLKEEQPYVNDYITWEYCYYDSPNNTNPGYQKTYIDYLRTGALESTPPTAPTNFTAVRKKNGDVSLSWKPSHDNIGVCGYYVYRDGRTVCRNQVPKFSGRNESAPSLTSMTDVSLRPNTNYIYYVRAYDFAGNFSAPTRSITINTGNIKIFPDLVSAHCPYTVSIPDFTVPAGTRNTKLTDGVYAKSLTVKDPRWDGFHDNHQKPRNVVIDLGKTMPVQQFLADFLLDPAEAVFLPVRVTILVSTDHLNFKNLGNFPRPNVPYSGPPAAYQFRYTLVKPVVAKYVDFRIVPAARWFDELTFEDEFEVRSSGTTP